MSIDTGEDVLSYEECREYALQYFGAMRSAIKDRTLNPDSKKLIPTLQAYIVPYLNNNELTSLETCLNNAVRDLRLGTRKRPDTRHFREAAEVIDTPPNLELAKGYEQVASYVSHEVFERMYPR